MDKQEAIERLKQNKAAAEFYAGMVQNTNEIKNELKDIEAIDMAIEALEKPTEAVTDCISRERAIEIVKRAETKEIAYSALINLEPKEIPTCDECRLPECLADKQDDWIPVSDDTLPDEDVDVNVTIKDFAETQTGFLSGEDWWLITKEGMLESYPLEYVIAWQPLPEPYKGGDK